MENSFILSNGSLGLNMSFANMWTTLSADQEKEIKQEFFTDITLGIVCLAILQMIREYDPKGCNIPLREWLMGFVILYFSRSTYQMIKI